MIRAWWGKASGTSQEGSFLNRFLVKVRKGGDGCWDWMGSRNRKADGLPWYGVFRESGKVRKAHRVSWEIFQGSVPAGVNVLHHCDNPACVNPGHLYLGTQADNNRDCDSKARRCRLTLDEQRRLYSDYLREMPMPRLVSRYGVSRKTVERAVSRIIRLLEEEV